MGCGHAYRRGMRLALLLFLLVGCDAGEAIVIDGRRVPVEADVVLWDEPGGLDAHANQRFEARFADTGRGTSSPFDARRIDLVVLHYDTIGDSRGAFEILEKRDLSAHFLIDPDGTIFQALDVTHQAWHATVANPRSVGIELAHTGAAPAEVGVEINGQTLTQTPYDPRQIAALRALLAALDRELPNLPMAYPVGVDGSPLMRTMSEVELANFRGVLGHWHVQTNKVDPGPALNWDAVLPGG